ncbi:hypothetical protein L602_003800000030 [Cupriavidus gilardii J11]|uniref:Uncharacterized protein n=1 Tax=Cupriavidus gilardii J11 TaxID=936133 RepID=A0A562BAB1_9BURK|nr:flagellin [Cupriavidus gilardii]TWG82104.1 hypothetical protein L602_003800000030 [Cupriavidus gilardii J11]
MHQNGIDMPARRRGVGAGAATLLGAAVACASPAWSSQAPRQDALEHAGAVMAARDGMAQWQPVAAARLEASRGGFSAGGLQVSFGIERAVYINGSLVVSTSLVIPDVSRITSEQAGRLAAALQTAANAGSVAAAALGGQGTASGTAAGAGSGTSASAGQPGTASASGGSAGTAPAQQAGAAALPPAAVIATATGAVSTNGLLNVIQNGPGNTFNAGALAGTPATVIQNSLNNQSIQSLLTIDAGVNTLQAFRAGIAASALDSALQRAASMR